MVFVSALSSVNFLTCMTSSDLQLTIYGSHDFIARSVAIEGISYSVI